MPNTKIPHIRWDAPTGVCFRETTSTFNNRDPPETVFEVEVVDNSECCTTEPEACTKTYEYRPGEDKCYEKHDQTTAEAAEGKEDCCMAGWNNDRADLRAACDI